MDNETVAIHKCLVEVLEDALLFPRDEHIINKVIRWHLDIEKELVALKKYEEAVWHRDRLNILNAKLGRRTITLSGVGCK